MGISKYVSHRIGIFNLGIWNDKVLCGRTKTFKLMLLEKGEKMELPVIEQAIKQDLEQTGVRPAAMGGTSPTTACLEVFGDDEGRVMLGYGNVLQASIAWKERAMNYAISCRGNGN